MLNTSRRLLKFGFTTTLKDLEASGKIVRVTKVNKPELSKEEEFKAIPTSPILGPIKIENPQLSHKTYRWCACGLSQSQPFCDQSHKGTSFKPFRFTVEENCKSMDLCGCKLTKNVPFCDKETCRNLK